MRVGTQNWEVIGVKHLETQNDVTIRVRIFVRDNTTKQVFSFEHDAVIWTLDDAADGAVHEIQGFAQKL